MPFSRIGRRGFAVGGAAAFAAGLQAKARAAQFEFKCASNLTADHPASVRLVEMWSAIERESGGRIHAQFFPNGQLGTDASTFSQLRLGALQFLLLNTGFLVSVVPAAEIGYLGFAFKDADEGLRAMDGRLGDYLRSEILAKGIQPLRTIWDSGMLQIASSSHPIRTPDDLRGFKIRVAASKIEVDLFKQLGATATPFGFSEIYTALQTKTVDGTASPLVTIESARFYEVQKYVALTNHAWSSQWLLANAEAWKSLPADLQDVVERNATRYALLERRDTKAVNAATAAKLRGHGIFINEVDQAPFRARLRSYYAEWATEFGSTEWGLMESALNRKLI